MNVKTIYRVFSLLLLLTVLVSPVYGKDAEVVDVMAEGVSSAQDTAIARDLALRDAQRRAVEKGVGVYIDAETQLQNLQVIEDSILSLYAKGMSTRDIDAHIGKIYDINISAEMVSKITNKILPIAQEWQTRLLEEIYSIIFLDGIIFNVREEGIVKKKTVYIVYGIDINGMKDILGIYIGEAESSKFWLSVLTDLKHRGVKDCLIACVDGLKGFREAIETAFPETEIQKCIVHQIRTSTKFVSYKDRKEFCNDMKPIYKAPNEKAGLEALDKFEKKWGKKYQYACDSWRNNWAELSTFFKYSPEIRRMIYTTNRIEGFNRILRKSTKTKSSFPSDNSLFKLLYLIVEDNTRKWTMPIKNWGLIVNELSIMFGERVTKYL